MLNELIDIFLGMYYAYVPADFPLRDYFASVIAVVITGLMICGSFIFLIAVVCETFKTIRGAMN